MLVILSGCNNSSEPVYSGEPKLVLTADKTTGSAPLTVKFFGKIQGKTDGINSQVPDYFFFSRTGKTVIPYSIPDTSQNLRTDWSEEITYNIAGSYKVVLLYQGIKDGNKFNLFSDSLLIKVN